MTYHYTYNITCLCGSLKDHYYYGQHTTDDLDDGYCGSGIMLQNYYKKYGAIENVTYTKTIIDFYSNLTELNQAEYELIGDKYETDPMCLNLRAGGNMHGFSSESIEKLSKSESIGQKKRFEDPEERKKSSDAANRRFEDQEEHNKLSEIHKKRWKDPEVQQLYSNSQKKRFEDPEERKKTSETTKLAMANPEVRKHQSDVQKKRYEDPEERRKNSERQKKAQLGFRYVNNGVECHKAKGEKLQQLLNEGYVYGMLKRNKNTQ